MATRTISTKLAITGESEYRASLTRINSEIKTLQSALKLTESQYQTNANSMQALTARGEALSNLYKAQEGKVRELKSALENAQKAEREYTQQKAALISRIEENNKRLEELQKTTGDTSKEEKALTDENKELTKQLEVCDANIAATEKGVNSWQTQLNNAQIKLNDLDAEIKLNGEYMAEAKNSADGCATSIDRFGDRVRESADKASELKDALAAAGVIAALRATADALEDCVTSAVSFESSMASVKRTVGGTDDFISELADTFKELSTQMPITTAELASIATTAGQLGIAQENVESFTTVMAQLATTTDLTADNAATMLAQFANITGVTDYERLGAVVAELGDATATTASKVVDMSQGMAAAASIAGMSERDILAISAAVGSLGIEAQAGSTAMSTLISSIYKAVESGGDTLTSFADVAGMSAKEFSEAWGNDPVKALDAFIQGLTNTERNGKSAIMVLDDPGINNVRQTKAILGLASAGDLLSRTINQANNAWELNTALGDKASIMYNTTEARLTMLSNAFENVKISVGDKLTPAVNTFAEAGTDALVWLADMIEDSGALVPLVTSLATAIGVLAAGVAAYTAVTKLATAAMGLFTAVMDANPVFLAVTAVAALAAGIAVLVNTIDGATPAVYGFDDAANGLADSVSEIQSTCDKTTTEIEATAEQARHYLDVLASLEASGLKTAESQEAYRQTVEKLNAIMPELNLILDEQTGLVKGGIQPIYDQIEAWRALATQEALMSQYKDVLAKVAEVEAEQYQNRVLLTQAETDHEIILDKLKPKQERLLELEKEQNNLLADTTKSDLEKRDALEAISSEADALIAEISDLNAELAENDKQQDSLNKKINYGTEAIAEQQNAIDEANEALRLFNDEQTAAAEGTDVLASSLESSAAPISDTRQKINDLAEAYFNAYEAAEQTIEGQISLFGQFKAELAEDVNEADELLARWGEQTEALGKYTENLQWAAESGLDHGLVASLADGSAESAAYLALIRDEVEKSGSKIDELGNVTYEGVAEFNAAWEGTRQARETLQETMAGIQVDLKNAYAEIEQEASAGSIDVHESIVGAFDGLGLDGEQIAKDFGLGLSSGIKGSAGDVASAAADMGEDTTHALRAEWRSSSPSKAAKEIGEDFDAGLVQGIDGKAKTVVKSATDMASDMTTEMKSGARRSVDAFDAEFSAIRTKTNQRIAALKNDMANATSSLPGSMYNVGQQTVNGMINGMNNRAGALYWTTANIVNTAIARARRAAAVASPSKKTTEIFEYVGEGMIVGIENRRRALEEKVQSVVDAALDVEVKSDLSDKILSIDTRAPAALYGASSGASVTGGSTTNVTHGGVTINVYGAPGQDVRELAEIIFDMQRDEIAKEAATWA